MAIWLRSEPRHTSPYPPIHHFLPEQPSFTEVKVGTTGVHSVQRDVSDSRLMALSMD